jgi:hypothetical protein
LTPCLASNSALKRWRNSFTGCMFTSLKVVSMAAVCCAATRRSATR